MSTTTTNYGLVKPELTDAADITAMNPNWDKIDEELSNIGETVEEALGNLTAEAIGASPSDHTHTAEQVGAAKATEHYLKTYDNLSRVGITAGSETIEGILTTLGNGTVLEYSVTSNHNASIYPFGYGKVLFRKISNSYASMTFWKYSGTPKTIHEGHAFYRDGAWEFYGWQQIFTTEGGTLTAWQLQLLNGLGYIASTADLIQLVTRNVANDNSNRRYLNVINSKGATDVANALKIYDVVNDTQTSYNIYGEHNITKGTTDIGAGSALANGCIHLVYE